MAPFTLFAPENLVHQSIAQWVRMRSFLWFNLAPHIHKYMGELAVHSSRNSAHFSVNTASRAISAAFLKIEN